MELGERDFSGGVESAQLLWVKEKERQWAVILKSKAMMLRRTPENEAEFQNLIDQQAALPPLWQRVCGFSPSSEMNLEPAERRAGIRRLLRVVETMFRKELKSEDVDLDGGPSKLEGGEISFAGRSAVWEPLNEICLYLEISKAKLNALSVQRTGLRVTEMCDCVRAQGLTKVLREKFRPLVREWVDRLDDRTAGSLADDMENWAWKFLKWMRGAGKGETRRKLAFEFGMTSRERLDRAALVCEGESLEAIEVRIAVRAIREAVTKPLSEKTAADLDYITDEMCSHGAGCDEVGGADDGDGPPMEKGFGEEGRESA